MRIMRTRRAGKIVTSLAVGGILAVAMAGQSQAADGGTNTCSENGGSAHNCRLYHIKLNGKNRCASFSLSDGNSFDVCRQNSMNVYIDPKISSVTVNINTADAGDAFRLDNSQNACFRLTQGERSIESNVSGVWILEKYDKLEMTSQGAACNSK